MNPRTRGLSWDENGGGKARSLATALVVLVAMLAGPVPQADQVVPSAPSEPNATVDVVVREASPETDTAEAYVAAVGGVVETPLTVIGGFSATVPAGEVTTLASHPAIASVTPDASLTLLHHSSWSDDTSTFNGYSAWQAAYTVSGKYFMDSGAHGQGVDVALIDSGVLPVDGLTYPGKVINGPDLSFESQNDDYRYLDTYGHGTHMAGIIAGRDDALTGDPAGFYQRYWDEYRSGFMGVAPGARIVSIKVAGYDGATDVSQVIAAIDWVVQHKNDNGLNIRVLNLSFGTDSRQSYVLDPLAYAVEQAWKAGIVVVVAAGNDGNQAALRNPAMDPFVIAVGATDSKGTYKGSDDTVTDFSNCGTWERHVDVVAPGRSIRSLRAPGSSADLDHPDARVGDRFFKGSGTSQAAAVVSGASALLISQRPNITPDQVKAMFMDHAQWLWGEDGMCQGEGQLNLYGVRSAWTPRARQTHTQSTGTGSLAASRGSIVLERDGAALDGEEDIFGIGWDGTSWTQAAALGTSWTGGDWNGTSWTGTSWTGTSWTGTSWTGTSWTGTSWTGTSWTGTSWSTQVWTGTSWTGTSWTGTSWTGTSWTGDGWSAGGWE